MYDLMYMYVDLDTNVLLIQFRDGVTRNLYTGVRCVIHVCRVQLDQLLSTEG